MYLHTYLETCYEITRARFINKLVYHGKQRVSLSLSLSLSRFKPVFTAIWAAHLHPDCATAWQPCACNENGRSCLDYQSSKLKTRGLKRKVNASHEARTRERECVWRARNTVCPIRFLQLAIESTCYDSRVTVNEDFEERSQGRQ